ncbi:MAG TPA: cytochrome d ubiquinol oxidase subunit II [Herpetosiphon sp.]|uniref:Cytochrome d ubiquinol oxidase, subunit II n=1 Tax=Herpetosiphon aurantiacus (strain ATCC 23779 / DSM 785 / 114-95) TaxID=316274 RepID=A9B7B1_HERA2|nr:cytochrome d ubiquinol oxidase subunit II [Herpetosiphon sp.]ABX06394.1 cytochrome d ubiquinol oxidase, subunit II [Herpetosiphon aurantiacus DSM 785]HBW49829.1 cytochrome d ubiquinol oxidase subunit II [Herpetosiphon sp.]
MDLNSIWFVLVAVLFIGFFILEGFDYGVGMLLPWLGRDDQERRVVINTIGPFWDGNEVWVLTAGGAIFAAFPEWYATLFSGFYLALFLMLCALIVRAVAFEYRSKVADPRWRTTWDWVIFFGSAVPALLWGVALGNLLRGVPIDADKQFVGNFFDLLNPYALLVGLTTLSMFLLHGALFLNLKTTDELRERSLKLAQRIGPVATVLILAFIVATYSATDTFSRLGVNPGIIPVSALLTLLGAGWFVHTKQTGWAFIMTCLTIGLSVITIFMALFPRVMISSLDPNWSLTIYNASSSPYTLKIMSFVALIFVPIVLGYQAWTYWVFRQRVSTKSKLTY